MIEQKLLENEIYKITLKFVDKFWRLSPEQAKHAKTCYFRHQSEKLPNYIITAFIKYPDYDYCQVINIDDEKIFIIEYGVKGCILMIDR